MTTAGNRRPVERPGARRRPAPGGSPGQATIDVVGSAAGLVLLAPILLVVWALVRATSPGPALFRQIRVGAAGRSFSMLKFRSMYQDADEAPHREYILRLMHGQVDPSGGLYKMSGDHRVTPVGAVLRRLSLDELPQLVNVLRGRHVPRRPATGAALGGRPPAGWSSSRFDVRPGITGLWQVSGRNRLTMLEAVALDVEYVRTRSCWRDLWILVAHGPAVLGRGGR